MSQMTKEEAQRLYDLHDKYDQEFRRLKKIRRHSEASAYKAKRDAIDIVAAIKVLKD